MSKKPRIEANILDVPAEEYVPGHLSNMQDVLYEALDQGALTRRTLQNAAKVGHKTLAAFHEYDKPWIVNAEIKTDTCVQRNEDYVPLQPHSRYPVSAYGEIIDISTGQHPDGREMIYAQLEGRAIGQYDQYVVPIAYVGDHTIEPDTLVDMPVFARDVYEGRVQKKELATAAAFAKFIGSDERSSDEVTSYLGERLRSAKKDGLNRYAMGLNLMFEDMYSAGVPFMINLQECWVRRQYDHDSDEDNGVYEHMVDEKASVIQMRFVHDPGTDIKIEWLAEMEDGDKLVNFDSDVAQHISFFRRDVLED